MSCKIMHLAAGARPLVNSANKCDLSRTARRIGGSEVLQSSSVHRIIQEHQWHHGCIMMISSSDDEDSSKSPFNMALLKLFIVGGWDVYLSSALMKVLQVAGFLLFSPSSLWSSCMSDTMELAKSITLIFTTKFHCVGYLAWAPALALSGCQE
ncbi:hypothetical protein HYC85_029197 [Camellia sinensis]|uniref:Uncharacterized protein n=1 Tax=Camellia sinensis TaxID=4442 RepID=A0A7J7G1C0_CAMSI|nr:hypothetical protein HYC85_029197 [Camellia sinensis]